MSPQRNKYFLLNFVFIFCLLVLLINDHYLKYAFSNWLTGKLSDAAGIIMLPLLLAFLYPPFKQASPYISALIFTFWKSPFSDQFIRVYNEHSFLQTSRVVDLTDLYVLILLPIPALLILRIDRLNFIKVKNAPASLILLPTIFSLFATSPPPRYYFTRSEGNLTCYNCQITVNFQQEEIVATLQKFNIAFESIAPVDSLALRRVPSLQSENAHVYRLNELIIDNDTLRKLDFTMRTLKNGKTVIHFNGMQVSQHLSTMRMQAKLSKYYRKVLFRKLRTLLAG